MDRTYNVFADNGLYVLGNELDKDIEDISLQDIKNSPQAMADKFEKFDNCDYYKKNKYMGFSNSSYTQKSSVLEQFNLMLNNIGDDEYCSVCGKKHIKLNADEKYLKSISRCFMPKIHANTFANYINNLQIVNICPICFYLSMLSLFNCEKTSDTLTLYISDDNEFMEDYTYKKQNEIEFNTSVDLKFDKKIQKYYYKYIEEIIEFIIHNEKMYEGYIQAVSFNNSGQTEIYIDNHISNNDIKFIKMLEEKSLLSEFKEKWLYRPFIDRKLQANYISYIKDSNGKIKISEGLLNEIERKYCKMSKEKLDLLKTICRNVYNNNSKDEIKQLKIIKNMDDFRKLLVKWSEEYKDKTNKSLFTSEEFNEICIYKEWKTVKDTMMIEFMNL